MKPFPSRIRYISLWRHRWTLLDLINQIAYGTGPECVEMVHRYGGSDSFGMRVWRAARAVIEVSGR